MPVPGDLSDLVKAFLQPVKPEVKPIKVVSFKKEIPTIEYRIKNLEEIVDRLEGKMDLLLDKVQN